MDSDIIRASFGSLNAGVGDEVIGMSATPLFGGSKFAGQLGKHLWLDPDQLIYDAAIGTLYGGRFTYVKHRTADLLVGVGVPLAIGQIVFWDTSIPNWQREFQVTLDENIGAGTDAGVLIAGIAISLLDNGKYWFIQDAGKVPVLYRTVALTVPAGAVIGNGVYTASLDTGIGVADNACADIITPNAAAAAITDIGLMQRRYLGKAIDVPVAATLGAILLGFDHVLG